jgi:hypothetical protein
MVNFFPRIIIKFKVVWGVVDYVRSLEDSRLVVLKFSDPPVTPGCRARGLGLSPGPDNDYR